MTLFHTKSKIPKLVFLIITLFPLPLQAEKSNRYYINTDERGVFIQTEHDGSYYIDSESKSDTIMKGQKGSYYLLTDGNENILLLVLTVNSLSIQAQSTSTKISEKILTILIS